jgi:3alpha(or 20beta)-hydroxysteroid dehydrogenase
MMAEEETQMAGRLEGKVALISGGARGQGEAHARLFVAEGAGVMLGDLLDEEGRKVAASLGAAARYEHLDVTREEDWQRIVARTTSEFGRLDVLINNAGILRYGPIESTPVEEYRAVVEVNQVGSFLGLKSVIPAMRASGGGSIVNISSVAGLQGVGGVVSYASSKWAVRGMTKVAALELGDDNIRVNSLHPGMVDTPMVAQDDLESVDQNASLQRQPLKRVAQPEEMSRMVLFLASDESAYCTGAEFIADGGSTAGRVHERLGD